MIRFLSSAKAFLLRKLYTGIYAMYNYQSYLNTIKRNDKKYSRWLRNAFCDCHSTVLFHAPVTIGGGQYIGIQAHTSIGRFSVITAWDRIKTPKIAIGLNCCFGEFNHITSANEIIIGNGVLTGRWVTITDNSHGVFLEGDLCIDPIRRSLYSKGPVKIGDRVWIGDKATILPGVTIGEACIVAANSVVTHDVPPNTMVAGCPAKIIKQLN